MDQSTFTFTDLIGNINAVLQSTFNTAAAGMTNYVLPLAWVMFGISMLVWSFMVMTGRIASPMNDWIMKGLVILLIISVAGQYYSSWVSGPLFQLPSDLSGAIGASGSPAQILDNLDGKIEGMLNGIAAAMVNDFSGLNIGGGVVLFVALIITSIAGAALLLGAMFNILYAQIGLAMVLAVGPFFIIWMIWKQTQHWTWSWLNTALYFVFLTVLTSLFIIMFVQIAANYMTSLETAVQGLGPGTPSNATFATNITALLAKAFTPSGQMDTITAQFNILRVAFQMLFICVPMFFVELQLPTIAASITGGSGGSFGSGLYTLARTVTLAAGSGK